MKNAQSPIEVINVGETVDRGQRPAYYYSCHILSALLLTNHVLGHVDGVPGHVDGVPGPVEVAPGLFDVASGLDGALVLDDAPVLEL